MLALKLGLSLVSTPVLGGWSPDDESSLEAWYQKGEGITLDGADVKIWADSSSNSYDMTQTTATEQPAYSGGVLSFVSGDVNNLQTSGQISLPDEFTIAIRFNPDTFSNVVIADNTIANEFIKIIASDKIRIKVDGSSADFDLDSGTFGDDYIVFTRDAVDKVVLWKNGIEQADTNTRAGTVDIDTIGVRFPDTNAYSGTISEIQIYTSTSEALTANINDRLAGL